MSTEEADRSAHQVTFNNLLAVLDNWEVSVDWRLVNVSLIYKIGRKDDAGTYRPVSLTSVPGKVIEQIITNVFT